MSFEGWRSVELRKVIQFSKDKIEVDQLNLNNYISTENMLPDKAGITKATSIPNVKTVTKYSMGNTLISNIRPYFKKIWYAINEGGSSNDVLVIENIDKQKLDNKFLYFSLSYDGFFDYVVASSKGTKMPRGDKEAILRYELNLPSLRIQQKIASILSSLDDKIELNNRMNKVLEQMAQAIFKQWFVDFEFPNENGESYKSSGGEMVWCEKLGKEIPKEWEIVELDQVVKIIDNRGKTPPLENEKTKYPIIDVRALSGEARIINYENCTKYVIKEVYDSWFRSGHPQEGDILISTVGSLAEMKLFIGEIGCIAQNVVALRSSNISHFYLFEYLKNIRNDLISYNIGSVQPSIKVTHFVKHKILKPTNDVQIQFHNFISNFSSKIYQNILEVTNLKSLRDTLLPKLMSGENDVSDIELDI